jgi:hypothetical protein
VPIDWTNLPQHRAILRRCGLVTGPTPTE